jgi:hypothetical protein
MKEYIGICHRCYEHTDARDPCCGAPVEVEGSTYCYIDFEYYHVEFEGLVARITVNNELDGGFETFEEAYESIPILGGTKL